MKLKDNPVVRTLGYVAAVLGASLLVADWRVWIALGLLWFLHQWQGHGK